MKKIASIIILFLAFVLISTTVFSADDQTGIMKSVGSAAKIKPIDINSATKEQLRSIPGIGDSYAQKIIDGRPYDTKAQLKSKKIIPDSVYEKIKDMIIAKKPK
jgi:competence protein ComEA